MTKITLTKPITTGDTEITEITLREPTLGDLRGLDTMKIMQVNADAYIQLLPRITTPALLESHAAQIGFADLTKIIEVMGSFFETSQPT